MLTRLLWPAIAIAALAMLAAPGLAQVADPAVSVAADTPDLFFGPTDTRTASWTVTNDGPLAATIALALPEPVSWTAPLAAADKSFQLAAGASRTISVPVALSETPQAGITEMTGGLQLRATATDQTGRQATATSAVIGLTYTAPPIPPTPRDYTAEIAAGVAAGVAVLLVAMATIVYVRRAHQVALFVDPQQRPITTGTDGVFLVEVQNKGRGRREVELRVEGLPATWYGAFSFPTVVLQPGERSPVPLCIKVPREAGDGVQVDIVLRARPGKRYPWLVSGRTRIEAHDRVRIGPVEPVPTPQP